MGLLLIGGTPLTWDQAKAHLDHVKYHGISQFLHIWKRQKDRKCDPLLWGDEVEYMAIVFDHKERNAKLSLRQHEILADIKSVTDAQTKCLGTFHPEYSRFMIESIPGSPFTSSIADLLSEESNMEYRRSLARNHMRPNEIPTTFVSFPRLGTPGVFTEPYSDPADAIYSHSLFLPHEITSPHVRFPTLTTNIRERRGSKVTINLPIFIDHNTPRPFVDHTIPFDRSIYPEDAEAKNGGALVDHIYLDAMAFGMGCGCLQATFQACSINGARRIYDALVPVTPILLALTAGGPVWRGYLADVDCRWDVIAASVDDRTEEERGLKPLKEQHYRIPKSRFDSVDMYISTDWINRPEYNDIEVPYEENIYERLRDHGVDDLLSKHISHLFIRDPLVIYTDTIDQDDANESNHFENIQSTNWQTLRFKPPPPNTSIGWRVEFRSMEVQMTDFENAAFNVFLILLSRAILSFHVNLYIPISKVDENMARAQRRDASRSEKFFFRKEVYLAGQSPPSSASSTSGDSLIEGGGCQPVRGHMQNCFPPLPLPEDGWSSRPVEDEYEEMTMDEIMNGKRDTFPGLLNLVAMYVDTLETTKEERAKIGKYLDFIRARSNGTLLTPATWIRNFIRSHPAYQFDSVVSREMNYDLLVAVDEIERGVRREPTLLPEDYRRDHDR